MLRIMRVKKSMISKCFSKHELQKLGCCAFIIFLVMEFSLCLVFNPPIRLKMLINYDGIGEHLQATIITDKQVETMKSIYNYSNSRSDVYEIYGDIRICSNSSTIFVNSHFLSEYVTRSWTIRPYSRKFDNVKIEPIREWNIHVTSPNTLPNCHKRFTIPAIAFSAGAFSDNYFHAFSDVLFPLYVTSMEFNRTVVFLISNSKPWWLVKFKAVFKQLSKFDLLDIDKENEVLCFSRVIVGLKADKEMDIDSVASPSYSIRDFRQFLRNTYTLERNTTDCHEYHSNRRPRVLIVSRKLNRHLRNEEELAKMTRALGGDVTLKELNSNITSVARDVNSFDVMIGVHGAGLTNMVFLPDNAVLLQIVPFALDESSFNFFGRPSRGMNLSYLEYKISIKESSLIEKYPPNSEVLTNPHAIHMKGFSLFHTTYLANQEVMLDLDRFKTTLVNALKIVKHCSCGV